MQPGADLLERVLSRALGAADYADAFYERRVVRSFRLQEGRIHEAGVSVVSGIGIRVISGDRAGYAHSDDLSERALLETASVAALIAKNGAARVASVRIPAHPEQAAGVYGDTRSSLAAESATYVDLLARADVAARAYDPRIRSVNASISDELQDVVIATSDGRYVTDRRPLVTLAVQCVAQGNERGTGFSGDGGRSGLDVLLVRTPEKLAEEAARIACVNCDGLRFAFGRRGVKPPPAGDIPEGSS